MSEINSGANFVRPEIAPPTEPVTPAADGSESAIPENGPSPILSGPSLSISKGDARIIPGLMKADYDSKMATAKNLVDSPEVRREKAARRKEEEAEAALLKSDEKRAEQQRELLDRIDANRQPTV